MPSLEDLGTRQIVSGTPAPDDLIAFYDVSEFGNNPVKKAQLSALAGTHTHVSADITDASTSGAANKLVKYNSTGGGHFANTSATPGVTVLQVATGNGGSGIAAEFSTNQPNDIGLSIHLVEENQTGISIDMGTSPASAVGCYVYGDTACFLAADSSFSEKLAIRGDGSIRWTDASRSAANYISLTYTSPTAARVQVLPDHSGTVMLAAIKTTTGDPAAPAGGVPMVVVNTFDNTAKIYADGSWRTIASGW